MIAKLINLSPYKGHKHCKYAFILDTYEGKCPIECSYCYTFQGLYSKGDFQTLSLTEIEKEFEKAFETDSNSTYSKILRRRVPIRIGGFVECFPEEEKESKTTLKLLKILKKYNYPATIITKSNLISEDVYMKELSSSRTSIQISVPFSDEKYQKILEPNAVSIEKRLQCISKLTKENIFTTARINPLFPIHPDGFYSKKQLINKNKFDIFSIDLFPEIKKSGATNIVAGFVHLNQLQLKKVSNDLEIDLASLMTQKNRSKNSGFRYSKEEIVEYFSYLKGEAEKLNLMLSPCYLGQDDSLYDTLSPLFSDINDCCNTNKFVKHINLQNSDAFKLAFAPSVQKRSLTQKLMKFILDNIRK